MIVAAHVATGAVAGAIARTPLRASLVGPALHLVCDRVPHRDNADRRFELASGIAGVSLLAAGRGPMDPATLGAVAACAPDLEHLFRFLRIGGSKLFHRNRSWHRSGPLPVEIQLVLAGAIIGSLARRRRCGVASNADAYRVKL
jgi:hypothetical protein